MKKSEKKKKDQFLQTLREKLGLLTLAIRCAGTDSNTVERWIQNDSEFAEQVRLCNELALDYVEGKMFEKINSGDSSMIKFYLETKGEKRGYIAKKNRENIGFMPVILTEEEALMFNPIAQKSLYDTLDQDNNTDSMSDITNPVFVTASEKQIEKTDDQSAVQINEKEKKSAAQIKKKDVQPHE